MRIAPGHLDPHIRCGAGCVRRQLLDGFHYFLDKGDGDDIEQTSVTHLHDIYIYIYIYK